MNGMFKRLLVSLLLFIPVAGFADDASLLGPQSNGNTGAASNSDSSTLQPGASSLQNGNSSGVGVSGSNAQSVLQNPASSDQSKLFIEGDVDNSKDSGGSTDWVGFLPIFLALAAAGLAVGISRNGSGSTSAKLKTASDSSATDPGIIEKTEPEPIVPVAPAKPTKQHSTKRSSQKRRRSARKK